MDLKKFAGRTVEEMHYEDMKLVITFEDGTKLVVASEDKFCGVELFE